MQSWPWAEAGDHTPTSLGMGSGGGGGGCMRQSDRGIKQSLAGIDPAPSLKKEVKMEIWNLDMVFSYVLFC
uniref:Uncharacterized protein n=1 Tax=Oryza meridionalis TaxID=40149 RepID=A0A0E0D4U7_9ORYZ